MYVCMFGGGLPCFHMSVAFAARLCAQADRGGGRLIKGSKWCAMRGRLKRPMHPHSLSNTMSNQPLHSTFPACPTPKFYLQCKQKPTRSAE
jgi:hypothetical protein